MTAITVQISDDVAEELRQLAAVQERAESDIVREALAVYVQSVRKMPKGIGKYRSGLGNVSEQARDLLREAVKDGTWP